MSNLTMKDLDYEKIIENYNKVEELENRLDKLENKITPLIKKLGDFIGNVNSKIDKRIKLYVENNNSIEKSQYNLVEEKKVETNGVEKVEELNQEKEKKLDISKFIEEFSQEFSFINKNEFNEEMENDEIMGKIIELIKRMLGIKDDEKIKELKILEDKLNKEIKGLEDEIVEKKAEVKSLNIEKIILKKILIL